ncbi:MAG: TetR/AcrR family transcriptional regulator, partial [Bacteroidota bacterium]
KNALHRIVLSESSKSYYTKEVDEDNAEGFFKSYKSLCKRIANIIQEINPDYPYPHTLISTVLESAHQQVYFAQHLPSLTNIKLNGEDYTPIFDYLKHLVFTQIKQ